MELTCLPRSGSLWNRPRRSICCLDSVTPSRLPSSPRSENVSYRAPVRRFSVSPSRNCANVPKTSTVAASEPVDRLLDPKPGGRLTGIPGLFDLSPATTTVYGKSRGCPSVRRVALERNFHRRGQSSRSGSSRPSLAPRPQRSKHGIPTSYHRRYR